jgi:hypothetical protein
LQNCIVLILAALFFTGEFALAKNYKGAELRTRATFTYGRVEAHYKPPQGNGTLGSLFTYHEISNTADWNEIDIEILGRYDNAAQFTTILANQNFRNSLQPLDFVPHAGFHTYAFEWTPEYVAWFIDGEEVFRQTDSKIATLNRDQKIMMNIWAPAYREWVEDLETTSLPFFSEYEWVAYYNYTPGAGDYGSGNNFTHAWTDEFDSFDEERWEKSDDHTWTGNESDLIVENVVYRDGKMILCLTDPDHLGYQDVVAPSLSWYRFETDSTIILGFSEALDSTAAVQTANYNLIGANVKRVERLGNRHSVRLYTDALSLETPYSIILMNIRDLPPGNNAMGTTVKTLTPEAPLAAPLSIDIGHSSASEYGWADRFWQPGNSYGRCDGANTSTTAAIAGTENDLLYQTYASRLVKYVVRIPNGAYKLTLHFSDPVFASGDNRRFDVYVNGRKEIPNLDIAAEVGQNAALDKVIENVSVSDHLLEVHFAALIDFPICSGLTLEEVQTTIGAGDTKMPQGFSLSGNFPNPFNPQTTITFSLPQPGFIELNIYNTNGELIRKLFAGQSNAGPGEVIWNGKDDQEQSVSSGLYLVSLTTPWGQQSKKMLLIK